MSAAGTGTDMAMGAAADTVDWAWAYEGGSGNELDQVLFSDN